VLNTWIYQRWDQRSRICNPLNPLYGTIRMKHIKYYVQEEADYINPKICRKAYLLKLLVYHAVLHAFLLQLQLTDVQHIHLFSVRHS
jgi:hypothetical protein